MSRYLELAAEAMREIRAHRELEAVACSTGVPRMGDASHVDDLGWRVKRWLAAQCVRSSMCRSNPRVLHREFSAWSATPCNEETFIAELSRVGLALDADGMVAGLAFGSDFIAALEYERDRTV